MIHLSRLVGGSPHDGLHAEQMPDLRAVIGDAVAAIEDAKKDAAALARVSRFDAWRRRMRALEPRIRGASSSSSVCHEFRTRRET
ncbi:hypothetical protein [Lysobacter sp. Root667]|uniref:hypothetical protein n=1 Tax=Lysobacter sp. Root667 TaxID=1736581 RepID=UPI0012DCF801|nr:hypothetical protein [Lysobacter sp. Root667]